MRTKWSSEVKSSPKSMRIENWMSIAIVGNGKTETETPTIALKLSVRWERIDIILAPNSSELMGYVSPRTTVISKRRFSGI